MWSLSGAALTGVFFTCAQMHLIDATTYDDGLMLFFDLIGIPASAYFLGRQTRAQRCRDGLEPPAAGWRCRRTGASLALERGKHGAPD